MQTAMNTSIILQSPRGFSLRRKWVKYIPASCQNLLPAKNSHKGFHWLLKILLASICVRYQVLYHLFQVLVKIAVLTQVKIKSMLHMLPLDYLLSWRILFLVLRIIWFLFSFRSWKSDQLTSLINSCVIMHLSVGRTAEQKIWIFVT